MGVRRWLGLPERHKPEKDTGFWDGGTAFADSVGDLTATGVAPGEPPPLRTPR